MISILKAVAHYVTDPNVIYPVGPTCARWHKAATTQAIYYYIPFLLT